MFKAIVANSICVKLNKRSGCRQYAFSAPMNINSGDQYYQMYNDDKIMNKIYRLAIGKATASPTDNSKVIVANPMLTREGQSLPNIVKGLEITTTYTKDPNTGEMVPMFTIFNPATQHKSQSNSYTAAMQETIMEQKAKLPNYFRLYAQPAQ